MASLCDLDKLLNLLEPQLPNLYDGKSNICLKSCGEELQCYLVTVPGSDTMDICFLFLILEGAHLNPAFSLVMCLLGCLPWAKFPIYSLVQLLSAFCASGA